MKIIIDEVRWSVQKGILATWFHISTLDIGGNLAWKLAALCRTLLDMDEVYE